MSVTSQSSIEMDVQIELIFGIRRLFSTNLILCCKRIRAGPTALADIVDVDVEAAAATAHCSSGDVGFTS